MDERSIYGRIRLVSHFVLLILALALAWGGWTAFRYWRGPGA